MFDVYVIVRLRMNLDDEGDAQIRGERVVEGFLREVSHPALVEAGYETSFTAEAAPREA